MRRLASCTSLFAVLMLAPAAARCDELPPGQYQLSVYAGSNSTTYCLLRIEKEEDKLRAEVTASHPQLPGAKVTGLERTDEGLRLVLNLQGQSAVFVGTVGDAHGSRGVLTAFGRTSLAKLEPTDKKTLTAQNATQPVAEQEEFQALTQERDAKERGGRLKAFIQKHQDSPLVFEAYRQLIAGAKQSALAEEDIAKFADQYAAKAKEWHPKWRQETLVTIAGALAQAEVLPDVAVKFAREAREAVGSNAAVPALRSVEMALAQALTQAGELAEEDIAKFADQYAARAKEWHPKWHQETLVTIASAFAQAEVLPDVAVKFAREARESVGSNAAVPALRSVEMALAQALTQAGDLAEAAKLLEGWHERLPADAEITFRLGQVKEKGGELDAAIELWSPIFTNRLVAGPLREAWRKKHGSLEGLNEHLDAIYLKQVPPLQVTPFESRQSSSANSVVLVELFTGAMCPPCVAADVAFDALHKTYENTQAIFLQYHLHIPGPDPITNPDSEARARYYGVRGTPSPYFNGKFLPGGGGSLAGARGKYDQYRNAIEPKLGGSASGSLKVKAVQDGEAIKITAQVKGLASEDKPLPEDLKLRLALVEELVRYPGPNGMWQHHSVVRSLPGGPDGVEIKASDFSHNEVVALADVRNSLEEYLTKHEAELAASPRAYKYPVKPIDLNHLKVVAFVQADSTKDVLLVTEVPVEVR